jgi:hypothetical protein
MAFYEIYGKWYHLSYSDYFTRVVKARSPRAALGKLARCFSGVDRNGDISWARDKPTQIAVGQLDPEPEFWVNDDQIYQVRTISKVKPQMIECPTCNGTGKFHSFVPDEMNSQLIHS